MSTMGARSTLVHNIFLLRFPLLPAAAGMLISAIQLFSYEIPWHNFSIA